MLQRDYTRKVYLTQVCIFISAPSSTKYFTTFIRPLVDAIVNAVPPYYNMINFNKISKQTQYRLLCNLQFPVDSYQLHVQQDI